MPRLFLKGGLGMCTSIVTTSLNGDDLFGRTLDFPQRTPWALTYLPRHFTWWDVVDSTRRPLHHALLGGMRPAGGHWLIADAVNDAGLMAAELYFPVAADYHSEPVPGKINLSPESFLYWLLDDHQTVADVQADLSQVAVVARKWFDNDKVFPFHWLVTDQTGTYVIEPLDQTLVIRKNPANILTNTPSLDQQFRRLNRKLGLGGEEFTSATKQALIDYHGPDPATNNAVDRFMKAALARYRDQVHDPSSINAFLKTVSIPKDDRHRYNYTHYRGLIDRNRQQYWFHNIMTGQSATQVLPELMAKYDHVETWAQQH